MQKFTASRTPIVVDFRGAPGDPSLRQTIRFESCIFENLTYTPHNLRLDNEYTSAAAVILATSPANTVIVSDSVFRGNAVQGSVSIGNEIPRGVQTFDLPHVLNAPCSQLPGAMIASLGAEVKVDTTCFLPNQSGQYASPILLEGNPTFDNGADNYVEGNWNCPWVGDLQSDSSIVCGASDPSAATTCQSSMYEFNVYW